MAKVDVEHGSFDLFTFDQFMGLLDTCCRADDVVTERLKVLLQLDPDEKCVLDNEDLQRPGLIGTIIHEADSIAACIRVGLETLYRLDWSIHGQEVVVGHEEA